MKKVFITGAPGWLGDRLVKALSEGLVDYPEIPRASKIKCLVLKGMDISSFEGFSNAEVVYGDITDKKTLKGKILGCDTVIHCAGVIHPKKVSDFYEINTKGTKNVLEEAIKSGVKRFVYVSSNSAAGVNRSKDTLLTEQDSHPYKNYGKSKLAAERIVQKAYRQGKIETIIVRPCWFYGPNQPPRQTEFFRMIKKGRPPLFGSGRNLRSMSYVDNVAAGLILAATVKRAAGNTYWIADGRPYETTEIYETIGKLLKVKKLNYLRFPNFASIIFEKLDDMLQFLGVYHTKIHVAGEMNKTIACSIEKAKKELGYSPKINLREGMKRSITWAHKNKEKI